jgi:hypothetical protein
MHANVTSPSFSAEEQSSLESQLARLRRSRDRCDDENTSEGVDLGKSWALREAEYDQLERVSTLNDEYTDLQDGVAWALFKAIEDDDDLSLQDSREASVERFRSKSERVLDAMSLGFIRGASEVFDRL